MEELDYDKTVELEANIKIKNKADELYKKFLKNVKLDVKNYKGNGQFIFWKDSYNTIYFVLKSDEKFYFVCDFLHENYTVEVTPQGIFTALKNKYTGVNHLESAVRDKD